jgi:plastocyanin
MRVISLGLLAGTVLLASGCSDHGDSAGPDAGPPPTSRSVDVRDNSFAAAAVRVAAGGNVRWTWKGGNQHNVTFAAGPSSATQVNGAFERTFATPGTFSYHCTIHGQSMSGTVTVVAPE